jgi:hypothetical protein
MKNAGQWCADSQVDCIVGASAPPREDKRLKVCARRVQFHGALARPHSISQQNTMNAWRACLCLFMGHAPRNSNAQHVPRQSARPEIKKSKKQELQWEIIQRDSRSQHARAMLHSLHWAENWLPIILNVFLFYSGDAGTTNMQWCKVSDWERSKDLHNICNICHCLN